MSCRDSLSVSMKPNCSATDFSGFISDNTNKNYREYSKQLLLGLLTRLKREKIENLWIRKLCASSLITDVMAANVRFTRGQMVQASIFLLVVISVAVQIRYFFKIAVNK
ncbi:hypothetical protein NECAME_16601 [Necator americanus]|uniref:Uncharacterized protein n=1 Tax=Necator americanus TaxID=51031 RepID=W2TXW7_NECAM|nr:hypothetical protein NECAME_16601 [Necator americanus]ETN85886.1 hypothetical protein NECAME_16601 [Necator americanus]